VSAQQRDEDDAQVDTATARVIAARQQVQAQGITQARYPPHRFRSCPRGSETIAQARTDVAVTAEVRDAQAAQTEIQANLNYLVINSPMAGT